MHGTSKFGVARYPRGLFDLLTVVFLGRYSLRPLHLFGGIGLTLITIGTAICAYLAVLKIGGAAIGERPLLLLGVLCIMVGAQFFTLGLLGQLIAATSHERSRQRAEQYEIRSVVEAGAEGRCRRRRSRERLSGQGTDLDVGAVAAAYQGSGAESLGTESAVHSPRISWPAWTVKLPPKRRSVSGPVSSLAFKTTPPGGSSKLTARPGLPLIDRQGVVGAELGWSCSPRPSAMMPSTASRVGSFWVRKEASENPGDPNRRTALK